MLCFVFKMLEKLAGNLTGRGLLGNISNYFWFQLISRLEVAPDQQPPEQCALGREILMLFKLWLPSSLTGLYNEKPKAPQCPMRSSPCLHVDFGEVVDESGINLGTGASHIRSY